MSTACPPPSASPTTRPSWTRCSPTPRATSPRVAYRRRGADRQWRDVTAGAFAAEVTAVARGLIAAGVAAGRPGGAALAHPLRVDADRLRDPRRRRGHRADLRDVLGRADPLDPVRLGRGRGRRGDRQARRARRAGARRSSASSRCGASSPRATSRARWSGSSRAAPTCRRTAVLERRRAGARRRPRHADLHLRHHRPSQGLRAHPPQHADRGALGRRAVPAAAHRGRLGAAVPAARARVRQGDPVRRHLHAARSSGTPRTSPTWSAT